MSIRIIIITSLVKWFHQQRSTNLEPSTKLVFFLEFKWKWKKGRSASSSATHQRAFCSFPLSLMRTLNSFSPHLVLTSSSSSSSSSTRKQLGVKICMRWLNPTAAVISLHDGIADQRFKEVERSTKQTFGMKSRALVGETPCLSWSLVVTT